MYSIVGASNEQGGVAGEKRENIGQLTLTVAPPIDRDKEESLMRDLRSRLDSEEDVTYRFGRPSYFSFRTPIEVEIRGYNLKLLDRLASDLVATNAKHSRSCGRQVVDGRRNPELQVRFDRQKLGKSGSHPQ